MEQAPSLMVIRPFRVPVLLTDVIMGDWYQVKCELEGDADMMSTLNPTELVDLIHVVIGLPKQAKRSQLCAAIVHVLACVGRHYQFAKITVQLEGLPEATRVEWQTGQAIPSFPQLEPVTLHPLTVMHFVPRQDGQRRPGTSL